METNNNPIENKDRYWLALEEYENQDAFRERAEQEFLSSPLREGTPGQSGFARRDFLKLMGASIAMTTAGCLQRPAEKIIPYVNRPPEVVPGIANYYASAFLDGTQGYGILVKNREGRPIHVDGNADFPINQGALSPRASAMILSLYDPDRLRKPIRNLQNEKRTNREAIDASYERVDQIVAESLAKGGVRVLTGNMPSPSTQALIDDFVSAFGGRHAQWSVHALDPLRRGLEAAIGQAVVPRYHFDRAKYIVSIDCDFLGTYLSPVEFARDFSRTRLPETGEMSRFVAFESLTSLTGFNADDRFRIRPSQQTLVAMGLAHEIVSKGRSGFAGNSQVKAALERYADAAQKLGIAPDVFTRVAEELWQNRGQSIVIAGGMQTQTVKGSELQIAVAFLNAVLENAGRTIDYTESPYNGYEASNRDLLQLISDMNAGQVNTLIIDEQTNPAMVLPEELGFRDALNKVGLVIYTGNYIDETGLLADYILPAGHSLENWNDYEFQRGVYAIQQPTVRPLFETRSFQDSLLTWLKGANKGSQRARNASNFHGYMQSLWRERLSGQGRGNLEGSDFDDQWVSLLHQGYYRTSRYSNDAAGSRSFQVGALSRVVSEDREHEFENPLELTLYTKVSQGDGSMANNAWLQELPDPVTKVTWDNYLCVSYALSKEMKLSNGDVVRVTSGKKTLEAPVQVLPGMHDRVVALAVGYGRDLKSFNVGRKIGQNAYPLAVWTDEGPIFSGLPVEITKTGRHYPLAQTQGHHAMEGRDLVLENTLENHLKNPNVQELHGFHDDIWEPHIYSGYKWGMTIDLTACIGCAACVVACQSENNVPVVGKKYVLEGREMHWLRIDRYYKGDPNTPDVVMEPMLCQHCENAPCERVCPVIATAHSTDGLSEMIYNRCVGTRYCSNNCPYKVRRFNWFDYTRQYRDENDTTHMALNPDVTVRGRGVMEKCSFCVQRIREGTARAKAENREFKDGDVVTACQAVCPTDAILFGDLNDPESRVRKAWERKRNFIVLPHQNTRPRIHYAAKVRNAHRAVETKHSTDGHAQQSPAKPAPRQMNAQAAEEHS